VDARDLVYKLGCTRAERYDRKTGHVYYFNGDGYYKVFRGKTEKARPEEVLGHNDWVGIKQ